MAGFLFGEIWYAATIDFYNNIVYTIYSMKFVTIFATAISVYLFLETKSAFFGGLTVFNGMLFFTYLFPGSEEKKKGE